MFFTEKVLIHPVVEQISSSVLSKTKMRIRINHATPLKTGSFHGCNTYCVWRRKKALLTQNKVENLFGGEGFLHDFFGYIQLQITMKTIFYTLCIFLKILRGGWGEAEGIFVLLQS